MKRTISAKVTARVLALLLLALSVLFVGAYHTVSDVILKERQRFSRSLLSAYADSILENSKTNGTPINESTSYENGQYGQYICDWYGADYVYLYVPNLENDTVRYINAEHSKELDKISSNKPFGMATLDYKLSDEELAVWNGEKEFGFLETNTRFGHESSTVMKISDGFGNTMIAGIDFSADEIYSDIRTSFIRIAVTIIFVLMGILAIIYLIIKRSVSEPAQLLSRSMTDFITDGERSEIRLDDSGDDEFAMIAGAFNSMTDDIRTYIDSIGALTREKERQITELEIASKIQHGFLPKENASSDSYDIHAAMIPARDVGGDLYDYFPLDDDRVLLVIADVSGKGISAAMFMSVTLMLIRQYAKMGLSPDEILKKANDTLSENNAEMLFATAFVAIYDSSTGALTYSNAGHNPPFTVGDSIRTLDGARGTLLGLFEGEEYSTASDTVLPGETLLLYTDGVSEATDPKMEFFGEARLEETLRSFRNSHSANAVEHIRLALESFSDGSAQHDDITMLTIAPKTTKRLFLKPKLREFAQVKELILSLPVPRARRLHLCLAAEERFANICSYAFPDGAPKNEKVEFVLSLSDRIRMQFIDGGQPFNPLENSVDIDEYDIDSQVGGLGNFLTQSLCDDIRYEYKDGKNILTLINFFEEDAK